MAEINRRFYAKNKELATKAYADSSFTAARAYTDTKKTEAITESETYTDTALANYLAKNNTTAYTPSGAYNPATKMYVDSSVQGVETQYTTMPTADSSNVGKIVQYVGNTNPNYEKGHFYECVEEASSGVSAYYWEEIEIQTNPEIETIIIETTTEDDHSEITISSTDVNRILDKREAGEQFNLFVRIWYDYEDYGKQFCTLNPAYITEYSSSGFPYTMLVVNVAETSQSSCGEYTGGDLNRDFDCHLTFKGYERTSRKVNTITGSSSDYYPSVTAVKNYVRGITGALSDLDTTDKTSLVNAINELAGSSDGDVVVVPGLTISIETSATYIPGNDIQPIRDAFELIKQGKQVILISDIGNDTNNYHIPFIFMNEKITGVSDWSTYTGDIIMKSPYHRALTTATMVHHSKQPGDVVQTLGYDYFGIHIVKGQIVVEYSNIYIYSKYLAERSPLSIPYTDILSKTNTRAYTPTADYHPATKKYVDDTVASAMSAAIKREIVQELPVSDIKTDTIYMVPSSDPSTENVYDEYMYINNAWEKIGSTDIDLTDYVTTEDMEEYVEEHATQQNTTMPEPSADNVGEIVQYSGESDGEFTQGYFYICKETEISGVVTYYWEQVNAQPDVGKYKFFKGTQTEWDQLGSAEQQTILFAAVLPDEGFTLTPEEEEDLTSSLGVDGDIEVDMSLGDALDAALDIANGN